MTRLRPCAFCNILRLSQQKMSQIISVGDRLSKASFNKVLNLLTLEVLSSNHYQCALSSIAKYIIVIQ